MYFWPSFSDMCIHRWTTVFRVSKSCAGAWINGIYPTVVKSGSHLLKAWLKADHVCDILYHFWLFEKPCLWLQQLLHLLRHLLLYWMFLFPYFHWTMEPINLLEHLLVQSYLIQGGFEEFHEKKAEIYLIANHF